MTPLEEARNSSPPTEPSRIVKFWDGGFFLICSSLTADKRLGTLWSHHGHRFNRMETYPFMSECNHYANKYWALTLTDGGIRNRPEVPYVRCQGWGREFESHRPLQNYQ